MSPSCSTTYGRRQFLDVLKKHPDEPRTDAVTRESTLGDPASNGDGMDVDASGGLSYRDGCAVWHVASLRDDLCTK